MFVLELKEVSSTAVEVGCKGRVLEHCHKVRGTERKELRIKMSSRYEYRRSPLVKIIRVNEDK